MARGHAVLCLKGAGKIKGILISDTGSDLLDRQIRIFQKFQGMLHPQHQQILLEGHVKRLVKGFAQIGIAHKEPVRKVCKG